jgi:thiol-disulfide isomerase/thioredoxin
MKPTLAALLLAVATTLVPLAHAQAPAAPVVEGKTIEGQPFRLSALKGKVVLVMFWSTGCAVCRDKMPELRQNY